MKYLLILFLLSSRLFAQNIENFRYEVNENNVVVKYNLVANTSTKHTPYKVALFYSIQNGLSGEVPKEYLIGDIGSNISVGMDKKITWNTSKHLNPNTPISLELELRYDDNSEIVESIPEGWDIDKTLSEFNQKFKIGCYPNFARENGAEGRVYFKFVVETDGSISNIRIIKGIGYGCDEEVVRAASQIHNLSPIINSTSKKAVRVCLISKATFKLE